MLKEITINELINKPVWLLDMDSGQITPAEDLFGSRIRILVDEKTDQKVEVPEDKKMTKTEVPEQTRKRRAPGELKDEIFKAWKKGERSANEISKITGININTVKRYIPC